MWRILAGIWRYLWRAFTIAVVLFLGYVVVTGVQVWLTSRHSEARPVQAIVVMGAAQYNGVPSPDLAARLAEAQSLWRRHLAPLVVVTGYKEDGDRYTEAQASGTWLVDHGLAADDIVEVGGSDSWANLLDAADALHQRKLDTVMIVTDGFHEDRCLAIASDVGLQAWPVPITNSPIKGWSVVPYFAKEAFGVAVGRVLGYSRLHDLSSFGLVPVG